MQKPCIHTREFASVTGARVSVMRVFLNVCEWTGGGQAVGGCHEKLPPWTTAARL